GKAAVIFGKDEITYKELNARANQLAHYLRARGAGPEVLIGIFVDRSMDMLVALLGVLKSGAAYVPLDPAYPMERIGFILQDAKAPILLTQNHLVPALPAHSAEVIRLDADWGRIAKESSDDLPRTALPSNIAYVLYTSGSTGKPKGVQVEHRNLTNFLESMRNKPGISSGDVLLALTTLSFDIAGLELYLPLVEGATVVLASREQCVDAKQLIGLLSQSGATMMQATPATWRMLIEAGWSGNPGLKVLCGGEGLPSDLADQVRTRCAELWNMYGPTETTIWSSIYQVTSRLTNTAPIGRPIANTTFYILDAQRQPVPIGAAGELYIGGDGVARGYFNRPELTAEKFVPDPFSSVPAARLYRTGDLARHLPDGNVQFLGRTDFQVKVRGFRIELGEIECAIAQHPLIQQAVVVVREDTPGDKRLVAYMVARGQISVGEVRDSLKQRLPDYMIPGTLVTLDEFPLTPNGKVDRRALPAPDPEQTIATTSMARTAVEEVLAEVWREVLQIPAIGIHDNFFALGGHSLSATRVVSRIQRIFKVEVPLRTIFERPTISQLAEALEMTQRPTVPTLEPELTSLPRDGVTSFPLSFGQQRLWVLDRLQPNTAAYNIPVVFRVRGAL